MGFWNTVGRAAGTALSYHPSVYLGRKAKSYFFDEPAEEQRRAAEKAGAEGKELGSGLRSYYEGGLSKARGEFGGAEDQYKSLYGKGGSLADEGYLEKFYRSTEAGNNPYYQRLQQESQDAIRQSFAARGGLNSGAGPLAEAIRRSELDAREYADRGRLAGAAQGARERRLGGGLDAAMGLGGARAGLYPGFYGQAGGAFERGNMAAIEAKLAAAGITGQQREKLLALLSDLFKGGSAAFGGS